MKKVVVHCNNYATQFTYEGDNVECGVAPHGLVVVEKVPDVTGKSDDGTTQRVLAQFNNWDAAEVQ